MSLTIGSLWEKDSKNTKANDTIANIPKDTCFVIKNNSVTRCMKFKLMYLLKLIPSHSKQIKKVMLGTSFLFPRVYIQLNLQINSYIFICIQYRNIELNSTKLI